ncbi:uncharacterized protein BDZ99DRAFT_20213 [Mytilinidion resinicola]|uniref:Uncharacterized protein n=1 Tax=Mytilinidion resinicola TaxID=574789 RepID=A0A6A6Z9W0_9PEZI|nr:uncharacterized protein BDZ99DRAFT_20213 [Mytilinidion resinicola]KAF2817608.1 hypothetical protein BDZ99DRAFT_20213 [Mytilinidion resinicola]
MADSRPRVMREPAKRRKCLARVFSQGQLSTTFPPNHGLQIATVPRRVVTPAHAPSQLVDEDCRAGCSRNLCARCKLPPRPFSPLSGVRSARSTLPGLFVMPLSNLPPSSRAHDFGRATLLPRHPSCNTAAAPIPARSHLLPSSETGTPIMPLCRADELCTYWISQIGREHLWGARSPRLAPTRLLCFPFSSSPTICDESFPRPSNHAHCQPPLASGTSRSHPKRGRGAVTGT